MIESRFWRQELRNDVAWLRRHQQFRRWSEKQMVLYERRLMLVAFQIRTLLERPKVGKLARDSHVEGRLYKKCGADPVNITNCTALEENFDLENPQTVRLSARDLCNQLIHHYVLFALRGERHQFEVVTVFSDYKRNICLYEFDVEKVIELFSIFADDASAVGSYHIEWNDKQQDYVWSTT